MTTEDGVWWSGPVHYPAALACLVEEMRALGRQIEVFDDQASADVADACFDVAAVLGQGHTVEVIWGGDRGTYCESLARLPTATGLLHVDL